MPSRSLGHYADPAASHGGGLSLRRRRSSEDVAAACAAQQHRQPHCCLTVRGPGAEAEGLPETAADTAGDSWERASHSASEAAVRTSRSAWRLSSSRCARTSTEPVVPLSWITCRPAITPAPGRPSE